MNEKLGGAALTESQIKSNSASEKVKTYLTAQLPDLIAHAPPQFVIAISVPYTEQFDRWYKNFTTEVFVMDDQREQIGGKIHGKPIKEIRAEKVRESLEDASQNTANKWLMDMMEIWDAMKSHSDNSTFSESVARKIDAHIQQAGLATRIKGAKGLYGYYISAEKLDELPLNAISLDVYYDPINWLSKN